MRMPVRVILVLVIQALLLVSGLYAQEKKENVFLHPKKFYKKYFPKLKVKPSPVDTSYIKTYRNYLSVASQVILPKINYNINPTGLKAEGQNAASRFRTNVKTILAFSASYRFVTAGFAISTKTFLDKNAGYAPTTYRTATIKYNNPKYYLEFKFIKLKGLTDINRNNSLDDPQEYITRPDITTKEYHFEGIYNFSWKKYSLIAPIDFTQRQVKSRAGFLLKAGVYNNQMYSNDLLISERQRPYFEEFDNINKTVGHSIKLAPGVGANLIFMKKFFLSSTLFSPFNLYFNKFYPKDGPTRKETSLLMVLDGMIGVGYHSKRFYTSIRYQVESKGWKLKYTSSSTIYNYMGLNVGYRFKAPRIVKKIYRNTMPPGM